MTRMLQLKWRCKWKQTTSFLSLNKYSHLSSANPNFFIPKTHPGHRGFYQSFDTCFLKVLVGHRRGKLFLKQGETKKRGPGKFSNEVIKAVHNLP